MQLSDLDAFKKVGQFTTSYPANVRRFFSPNDDVHGALMAVLGSARLSVAASMYGFDAEDVNQLLLKHAHDPNMPIVLCLDKTQAAGRGEVPLIAEWPKDVIGSELMIGTSIHHAINHLKLFVIDGLFTIGGSTNLSTSGMTLQNNELIVVCDAVYAAESRAKIDLCADEMRRQMALVAASPTRSLTQ